jgi:uncharacterized NAD-dependent epimerase/dehydratase family protein
MKKVIVATDGLLKQNYAKTAHGLIRGSERFEVLAIIDTEYVGFDAGELLDGNHRNIPVLDSIESAIDKFLFIDYLVIGVATVGGVLSDSLHALVLQSVSNGLGVVNGLHQQLSERQDINALAMKYEVELIDIRKPKPIHELHFWTGEIFNIDIPVIVFLAMDCAMGKRTTARLIMEACDRQGINAEMIYTGQTGWMQGSKYGFIFDSTINDFVSGELEHAILTCYKNEKPDLILLEGQSSLRNPSGPCGLELIISGNAKQVILSHSPHRKHYDDDSSWGLIPSVASEIEIIEKFNTKVIALALNTHGLSEDEALVYKEDYEQELGIPVIMPLEEGVEALINAINIKK